MAVSLAVPPGGGGGGSGFSYAVQSLFDLMEKHKVGLTIMLAPNQRESEIGISAVAKTRMKI